MPTYVHNRSDVFIQVIPAASEEQLLLVELVRSISVMRAETVMQTVKEVLKQPPAIAKDKVRRAFLSCLQFYFRNNAGDKIFFVQ